jgi:hypothetical protein
VAALCLFVGGMLNISPLASAAPPSVTVSQPVEVKVVNPVAVQGTVEVLNDALKTPYYMELVSLIPEGSVIPLASGEPRTVPVGKRFVVETVTAYAETPAGQYPNVLLFLPILAGAPSDTSHGVVQLFLQHQGSFFFYGGQDFSVWKSAQPLRLIVDSNRNSIGASFTRSAPAGQSRLSVYLAGYLEDL